MERVMPQGTTEAELKEREELIRYVQELIGMMTTEDEEINRQNLVMLTDEIYKRLTEQGVKAEKR